MGKVSKIGNIISKVSKFSNVGKVASNIGNVGKVGKVSKIGNNMSKVNKISNVGMCVCVSVCGGGTSCRVVTSSWSIIINVIVATFERTSILQCTIM